ncbi:MAG: energy transducer TonB [Erythrobacter sp.]
MGVRGYLFSAVAVLTALPFSAQAQSLQLEPTSEWNLREYEDKCRVSRVFGVGENAVTLWLDQGGSRQNYNLTLIGEPLGNPYGPAIRIKPGDEEEIVRSYIKAKSSKGRPVLRMYGLTLVQPKLEREDDADRPDVSISEARAAAIQTLRLREAIRLPLQLQLGAMGPQFAFLQECGARLERTLTSRSRALTGEAQPPSPLNGDKWLSAQDWPAYLRRAKMEGTVTFRLTVGKNGKPSACSILRSNKPQLFDDAVCLALLKRAKFEPARDGEGEPVASYYLTSVTFRFK